MPKPIYMDYQATTPMDPRVFAAMQPYFLEHFGNPASRTHAFGWKAEEAVEEAREKLASAAGVNAKEVIFTSGATEANNLAIKGIAEALTDRGNHIITVATEHKAVLDVAKELESKGFRVTVLGVDSEGLVSLEALEQAITDDTILVSVMHANNEIGVVQPVADIGAICQKRNVVFHSDAAQSFGKLPLDWATTNADLISLSAHKLYGPKGVGALLVRRTKPRIKMAAQIVGGGHERGLRSGTLPVPLIVGFAEAATLAIAERESESTRLLALRQRLQDKLGAALSHTRVNGSLEHRLAGNLNMSFGYVEGEALLMSLGDVAVSSGSACTSDSLEASYVLQAIGVPDALAHSAIRFGMGRFTTADEVDDVANRVIESVGRLRELSPLWELAQQGVDPTDVTWTPSD